MATNPMLGKARQKMQETAAERSQRENFGFPTVESTLPRHNPARLSIIDNLSSYLGARNPLASEVSPKTESVWLLDNTAFRPVHPYPHRDQPWQAEFVAAYFERGSGGDLSKWVADIADKIGLAEMDIGDVDGEARIAERLLPFAASIRPAKFVNVKTDGAGGFKLGPGGRNAISSQIVTGLGERKDGDVATTIALPEGVGRGDMVTHFAEPEGWAVISDIDDTIKITMTPSPIGILRSTFLADPTPISGMPELYRQIASTLDPTWFYLSASPYNLYTFLRPFLRAHYPHGTTILRDASWMDVAGFLGSLTQGTQAYKVDRISKVREWLPRRRVLCVGDSTQSDPESYGEIYRRHKGWVRAIFIRRVTDAGDLGEKNEDKRFEEAFRDVPRSVWRVFDDPKELVQAVEGLKNA